MLEAQLLTVLIALSAGQDRYPQPHTSQLHLTNPHGNTHHETAQIKGENFQLANTLGANQRVRALPAKVKQQDQTQYRQ